MLCWKGRKFAVIKLSKLSPVNCVFLRIINVIDKGTIISTNRQALINIWLDIINQFCSALTRVGKLEKLKPFNSQFIKGERKLFNATTKRSRKTWKKQTAENHLIQNIFSESRPRTKDSNLIFEWTNLKKKHSKQLVHTSCNETATGSLFTFFLHLL